MTGTGDPSVRFLPLPGSLWSMDSSVPSNLHGFSLLLWSPRGRRWGCAHVSGEDSESRGEGGARPRSPQAELDLQRACADLLACWTQDRWRAPATMAGPPLQPLGRLFTARSVRGKGPLALVLEHACTPAGTDVQWFSVGWMKHR